MTTNYEDLRKKASVKSALPEGWGRSVVGRNEIITAPTQRAVPNPLAKAPPVEYTDDRDEVDFEDSLTSMDANNSDADTDIGSEDDRDYDREDSRVAMEKEKIISEEQIKGIRRINGFREKDLANQYRSLMKQYGNSSSGQQAINDIINEEDDGNDEALTYLKESIKYGRGQ